MDITGRPIEGENLSNGGEIQGDLDIDGGLIVTGDAVFEDILVNGTATINTLITEQQLKIEDPLIELGITNPSDNLNLGIIEHWNDGATDRYSGLIRDRTTKKQYLYENSLTLPTTTTDMGNLQKGNLVLNNLESNNLKIISANNEFLDFIDNGNVSNTWSVGRDLNLTDNLEFVYDKQGSPSIPLIVKQDGIDAKKITVDFQYTLPLTDGTADQIIKTDGNGNLSFTDIVSGGNLQDAFNLSTAPQITTTVANPKLQLQHGAGIVDTLLELKDNTNKTVVDFQDDRTIFNQQFVRHTVDSGNAFQEIKAGAGGQARLIVGESGNVSSTINLFADDSLIDIRGIDSSKLSLTLASNYFSLIQDSTNPDVLRLDNGIIPGSDVRMRIKPTTGEATFGPDEKIKLKDTGEINCETLQVQKTGTDNITVGIGQSNNLETVLEMRGNNLTKIELIGFSSEIDLSHDSDDKFRIINDGSNELVFKQETDDRLIIRNTGLTIGGDLNGYTIPYSDGVSGQYLTTDGAGVVSWETPTESPPPNISIQQGGAQTLADGVIVPVNFSVELFKNNITHDNVTNNSRITITDAGLYSVSYDIWFDPSNDGGRVAFMAVNGLLGGTDIRYGRSQIVVDDIGGDTNPIALCGTSLIDLNVGDFVEVFVSQNSGAPLDIGNANISTQGEFTAFKVQGSGGGAGGSQTLQQTYALSTTPEITTNASQGLTIKSGGTDGLEQVLKIEDNLGVVNARINASGLIVGDSLSITTDANVRNGLSLGSIPSVFDYSFPVDNQTADDGATLIYDSASRALEFDNKLNFSQTVTTSAINNALQQEFTGAGIGSRTIPANTLKVGSRFKIRCMGTIQTTGVQTMTIRVFLAGILVAVSKVGTLNILTPEGWIFDQDMTIRTLGAGGIFNFNNTLSWNSVGGAFSSLINDSVGNINTTQDNLIQVFAQWGGTGLSNQMFCRQLTVEQLS